MWKLVIEDDEAKRTVVPLTRDQYSVGRKEGNAIRLTERNVSREHARLYKKQNGAAGSSHKPTFVLEDLTSYNGVFVNGLRITHAQDLSHGDLVQIGDYRIVLQDELLADVAATAAAHDTKATLPQGGAPSRAAALMDRPNRLVMLAGPTPGTEFPLDGERMTVGRAEDASVSINHNSVSRLHCEVHSIGDGRFEIVDKGSSNGVRVNGADLRRGIVEPGDVIELGDVKFKFIGAGQIFRPTESQQLAVLNDRMASEIVRDRRVATALPFAIFGIVVAAGAIGAWVYSRPHTEAASAAPSQPPPPSPDQLALAEAVRLCGAGDCEAAHDKLSTLPEGSPARSAQTARDIAARWADWALARGDAEPDVMKKRALFQRVAQEVAVDPPHRKAAADRLQQLDSVAAVAPVSASVQLPAAAKPEPLELAASPRSDSGRRTALAPQEPVNPPPSSAPAASPTPTTPVATATPSRSGAGSVDDKERLLALQGTQDAKLTLKQQLEQKVYGGRASDTEVNLLISTCKDLGDKLCVGQARQIKQQRQNQ